MRLLLLSACMVIALPAQRGKRERPGPENIVVGEAAGPVTLASINQRWLASASQIRYRLDLAERTGKGGAATKWVDLPKVPGGRKGKFRVTVSDHKLLAKRGYLIRNRTIRPGTMFRTIGWGYLNPKKEEKLFLDLEFNDAPVRARLEFEDAKSEDLEDVERAARIEIFALSAAPSAAAGVRIQSAAVEPATAPRGAQIDLVVRYAVQGAGETEVNETRRLLQGETVLATFEERVRRTAGDFTSAQRIQIPPALAPGSYTFQVTVASAGASSDSTAVFVVR